MNLSRAPAESRPRGYDREASRQAIVAAAMHLFAEHGFAATRVEDIVQAAGYTRGAFYFHFENKLDCFWAVAAYREQLRGDWVAQVVAGADASTHSLEQVLSRTFAHFAEAEQGVSEWVLVMVDFFQQHRDDARAHERIAALYAGWHDTIVRFVRALQQGGWVPAAADAELLATELFAFVEGLTVHARLYRLPDETRAAVLIDGLVALLTRA
jgi:AcrR family transcriptional regulator